MTNDIEYTEIHEREYFETECKPLLDELCKKCGAKGIPFFFSAAVENSAEGTEYIANGVMTKSRNIELKNDHIKYHMMVNDGCVAKPAAKELEILMDVFAVEEDDEDYEEDSTTPS